MNINNDTSNMPAIRFEGFSRKWEEKKMEELAERGFDNGVFNDPSKVGRGYKLINVKDMYSGSSIDVSRLSRVDIDEGEFIKNKVGCGDIFFTRSSLVKEGIAYSNVNISNDEGLTFDGHLIRMRPCKATTVPIFLSYIFKTDKIRRQFILGGKTTTMTTIGQNDIAKVNVAIPVIQEQTKIGNYFQQLDTLIAQHQQKHDKLLNLKKAMLGKMFPQQGQAEPEIRFKGFSGEWEAKKIDDITTYIKGFAFKSVDYRDNGTRIIRVSDLTTNSLNELNESNIYINTSTAEQYSNYIIKDGDIVITTVGSKAEMRDSAVGRAIIFNGDNGFLLNQNLVKLAAKKNNNSRFIHVQLRREQYAKFIENIQRGNANQANIAINDLWEYLVHCPNAQEQTKIGNYFQQLDTLIDQHQIQLKKLSNIKQACLEKMFV